jgi:hypothetical protein
MYEEGIHEQGLRILNVILRRKSRREILTVDTIAIFLFCLVLANQSSFGFDLWFAVVFFLKVIKVKIKPELVVDRAWRSGPFASWPVQNHSTETTSLCS